MSTPLIPNRLVSLDIFRGITIAGMILVNNPGDWSHVYAPLLHAEWHGVTPTDWIFPFFLFIVGVAIPLSIDRRIEKGAKQEELLRKVIIRATIILGIGLFLNAFPWFGMQNVDAIPWLHFLLLPVFMVAVFLRGVWVQPRHNNPLWQSRRRVAGYIALGVAVVLLIYGFFHYDLSGLRLPGVLQRIALVYLACGVLNIYFSWKTMLYIAIGLLLGYWVLLTWVPVPGGIAPNLAAETNLGAWLDRTLLTSDHLWTYSKTWDPEGLLSTLPAIASGISGVLTGKWIRRKQDAYKTVVGIMGVGVLILALAFVWDLVFPFNKKIWTSSYVLFTSGVALLFLGTIYWIVDILNYRKWAKPFVIYGMNALSVFVLSGVLAKLLYHIKVGTQSGESVSLKSVLYESLFASWLSPYNASLAYALTNVLFFLLIAWLLYRNRIFIKV